MVQDHNKTSAALWSSSGAGYDIISYYVSDALAHAAQALWPQSGEHILDIATGTGWTARNVAYMGANVTGVDIADELLATAKSLSRHMNQEISFLHADAEDLPFKDGEFDGVISTFGIMFAGNHEAAANELVRVCRKGGRISLATWLPGQESFIARMFAVVAKHNDNPPPSKSPLEWGLNDYVHKLLGDQFDLVFSEEITTLIAPNGTEIWDKFYNGFGPVRLLADRLNSEELSDFKKDFIGLHEEFRSGNRLQINRKYLLTTGVKK